ncbi:hypothetical protein LXL04_022068 [Taraxacum kok-saghyz]
MEEKGWSLDLRRILEPEGNNEKRGCSRRREGDREHRGLYSREKGAVTNVKDQGSCGACWSFSATGAMEGINQITTGSFISLSEQELVDCDRSFNNGCEGGLMDYAYEFVIKNKGIDTEQDYPYKAKQTSRDKNKRGRADFDSKTDGTRLLTESKTCFLVVSVIIKTIFMLICFTGSKFDFSVDFNSCCSVAVAVLLPKIVIPYAYLSKCFS